MREEIWPIVAYHARPLADEIGEELWQRVSLWRFAWRMAYDRMPLPELELTNREWHRFVEEEVVPAIESRMDRIVTVVETIVLETIRNEAVKDALRRNLMKVVSDPEFQKRIAGTLRAVVVDNERMRAAAEQVWTSPEAIGPLQPAASRFEPALRRIATMLLGSLEEGIRPEFARVLRTYLLGKDRRWLLLEPGSASPTACQPSRIVPIKARLENWSEPPMPLIVKSQMPGLQKN